MDHEYVVLGGINRAQIGKYLARTASIVSGLLVWTLLQAVDIAKGLGLSANLPPVVLSLLGAGTVYAVLYLIFRRWIWRIPLVMQWLKVADLSGTWICEGHPFPRPDSHAVNWKGTMTITQDWDRVRIHLDAGLSKSNSDVAGLVSDPIEGFVLLYSYRNEPKAGEIQLNAHRGFARLVFAKDMKSGNGDYFTGDGRHSSGNFTLRKQ
ncbi:hypothetical protein MUG10_01895 [Xanthomonas prunicola]|uniref:SMODS-associating 2TM beta-strand rich effector domain-containing protein n=2 Tax=Xanthomonas TaxID=338 RepID=A0A9Q9IZS8_9XANT|nr:MULTISPECIES: hypothetical protein [Xanthomonas]MEB1885806.1 hypothetical protein [Xanthomonas campestris pv. campestris]MEA9562236.1 hypothetical protein [Xanthomonas campestris]MEA9724027.1 hypothetical protein [Xanthomonas campestris]USJ01033.1 hypothetical protein MUG10_01895 [Xanthomonas prunicola]UXA60003.1 hypothetical protein M0D48_13265 [Xanthomonas prunicola]